MKMRSAMKMFEFSIIASGLDPQADDFECRFFDAGCDDATIAFQKGYIVIDFAREANSIDEAIASAMENVIAAGATIERVEPDPLVSLSDIAARSGMSRAAMSLYAKGERGQGFPAPLVRVTSESPLWDWSLVAAWLFRKGKVSRDIAMEAAIFSCANRFIDKGEFGDIRYRLRAYSEECAHAL